jgi:hypothetical protein
MTDLNKQWPHSACEHHARWERLVVPLNDDVGVQIDFVGPVVAEDIDHLILHLRLYQSRLSHDETKGAADQG